MPATWNGTLSISLFSKGPESLSLTGLAWPVEMRPHPRARSVRLRIDEARGLLLLTYPRRMSRRAALDWATKQADWVEKQLAAIEPAEPFDPGATVPVEGIAVRLHWDPGLPRTPQLAGGVLSCGGPVDSFAGRIEDMKLVWRHDADLAVLQIHHFVGVAVQCRRVRGDEVLAVADAENHRAAQSRTHHQIRISRADNHQAIGALQQRQDLLHRFREIAVQVVGN